MPESSQRAAVVAEALTWLGTPWAHRGRVKGVGVDCAQFVLAAYAGAGVIQAFDTGEYPRDWHIHKGEERFLSFVLFVTFVDKHQKPKAARPWSPRR